MKIVEISYELESNTKTNRSGFKEHYIKRIYLEMPESVAIEAGQGVYDIRIFEILNNVADLQDCVLIGINKVTY